MLNAAGCWLLAAGSWQWQAQVDPSGSIEVGRGAQDDRTGSFGASRGAQADRSGWGEVSRSAQVDRSCSLELAGRVGTIVVGARNWSRQVVTVGQIP